MQAHTKKHPTESGLVPVQFMVHPLNVARITRFVESIEPADDADSYITSDDFFNKYFTGQSAASVALRGYRYRENLTQKQLSELTGIPQRHISAMEHDKRTIGKAIAQRLAKVLNCDYRRLL